MGVTVELDDAVATVTFRWPEKRNAIGPDEAVQVKDALNAAVEQGARCIVLTGEGAFCAGGDLQGMKARAGMAAEDRKKVVYAAYQGMIRALVDVPVPTIAAVDGPAVGMGFDLALACDSRIVGPAGWARQGWGGIGVIPGTGGLLMLQLRAPGALWKILAGQPKLPPARLEQLGLGEATDGRTASEVAHDRARGLVAMPAHTLAAYVELDRKRLRRELDEHLQDILDVQVRLLADPQFTHRVEQALSGS